MSNNAPNKLALPMGLNILVNARDSLWDTNELALQWEPNVSALMTAQLWMVTLKATLKAWTMLGTLLDVILMGSWKEHQSVTWLALKKAFGIRKSHPPSLRKY
jgi:hypothetical protein